MPSIIDKASCSGMRAHSVGEVAKASGVSVRALRHYDEIGLLKPAYIGPNGYRYYGREELLRLQQILFHREIGFPLDEIRRVLDASDFDRRAALRAHRARLTAEARRYRSLIRTLDATIAALEKETEMDAKTMFRGFSAPEQAEHEDWLVERYGEGMRARIGQSYERLGQLAQGERDALMIEFEALEHELAKALVGGLPAEDPLVQAIMRRHADWIGRTWNRTPTAAAYAGLGELYQLHPDFRARYEGRAAGLADYLAKAMRRFAQSELA